MGAGRKSLWAERMARPHRDHRRRVFQTEARSLDFILGRMGLTQGVEAERSSSREGTLRRRLARAVPVRFGGTHFDNSPNE